MHVTNNNIPAKRIKCIAYCKLKVDSRYIIMCTFNAFPLYYPSVISVVYVTK